MPTPENQAARRAMVWPAVALAAMIVAAVTVLAMYDKDPTIILVVVSGAVLPILGALLVGQVQTVKEQTNGQLARLLELVDRQTQLIAASPAVLTADDANQQTTTTSVTTTGPRHRATATPPSWPGSWRGPGDGDPEDPLGVVPH